LHSCLTLEDAAQGLLAVKTLGKDPAGSKFLAEAPNLLTLLGFATTFKDDLGAFSEALRSIANALLLIEEARSTFISENVNGGDACILILEVFFHFLEKTRPWGLTVSVPRNPPYRITYLSCPAYCSCQRPLGQLISRQLWKENTMVAQLSIS
jgi:hypothetical protein